LAEACIDLFLLFSETVSTGLCSFSGTAFFLGNTLFESMADLDDEVETSFESVVCGDLLVLAEETSQNLEDDLLGQEPLFEQLTDEVDVTEELFFLFEASFGGICVSLFTFNLTVFAEHLDKSFTAVVEHVGAE
jgi:hypothetical protein